MCLRCRQRWCRHSGCHRWGHMWCLHRRFGPRGCLLHLDPLLGELGPVHLFVRHVLIHGGMNRPLIPRSSGSGPHDFYLQQFLLHLGGIECDESCVEALQCSDAVEAAMLHNLIMANGPARCRNTFRST